MNNSENTSDHDLLIDLRAQVRELRDDIKRMNDGGNRVIADHETRIRLLEKYVWLAVGALYFINAAIGIYLLYKKP